MKKLIFVLLFSRIAQEQDFMDNLDVMTQLGQMGEPANKFSEKP